MAGKKVIGKAYYQLLPTTKGIKNSIQGQLSGTFKGLGKSLSDDVLKKSFDNISKNATASVEKSGLLRAILKPFENFNKFLFDKFTNSFKGFRNIFSNAFSGIDKLLGGRLSNSFSGIKNTLFNLFNRTKTGAVNIFSGIVNSIKEKFPTAIKGIKNTLSGMFSKLSSTAKSVFKKLGSVSARYFTLGFSISLAGVGVIVAGLTKITKDSISEGAKLQQSIGGIETLFGKSADKVIKNARKAYITAGVSANDYMENVTSFSASLLQSLGGNTKKAAEIAHTAMVDMSDNANKMGTDMESIQNAYQGFAKQNYTMLDNLKLGYGGTKEEMERLLEDATKLTGVEYDIDNFSDIISGIHAIQNKLKVTGTTAKEAQTTFTGSFLSMKASLHNFLGSLALGENIMPKLMEFGESLRVFVFNNLLPMIGNVLLGLGKILLAGFENGFNTIQEWMNNSENIANLINTSSQKGREIINALVNGIFNAMPLIGNVLSGLGGILLAGFENGFNTIQEWINNPEKIANLINTVSQKGGEIINALVDGIFKAIPYLISKLPTIIKVTVATMGAFLYLLVKFGIDLLVGLAKGLAYGTPKILKALWDGLKSLVDLILKINWLQLGIHILKTLANGILSVLTYLIIVWGEIKTTILEAIAGLIGKIYPKGKEVLQNLIDGIKSKLNFAKYNMIEIGEDLIRGLWNGIANMWDWITEKIGGFGESIINSVKGVFGIHSPSRVMREEIGKNLALGIGEGINKYSDSAFNGIDNISDYASNMLNNNLQSIINSNLNLSSNEDLSKSNKPVEINLNLGGRVYKAFIEDIDRALYKNAELRLESI